MRHAGPRSADRFHWSRVRRIGLSTWKLPVKPTNARRVAREIGCRTPSIARPCAGQVLTAEPIGVACNLVPIVKPACFATKRRLGPLSGVSREEGWSIYAQSKSHWIEGDIEYSHPGGESYADIRRRVIPILEETVASHGGQTVIIVAHGVVIRVILTTLLAGYEPGDFDRVAIDFASINDLWFDGANWMARELNRLVATSTARPVA